MITFFDLEVSRNSKNIVDIGFVTSKGKSYHGNELNELKKVLKHSDYVVGHNIIDHDLKYVFRVLKDLDLGVSNCVDTLFISPLMFPKKPYHSLLKDDKFAISDNNNPLNDSKKSQKLLDEELEAFYNLDEDLKKIYSGLLHNNKYFVGFFNMVESELSNDLNSLIRATFDKKICSNVNLEMLIESYPCELAYALAIIYTDDIKSITPPWVTMKFPEITYVMHLLRGNKCEEICEYCGNHFDGNKALQKFFHFPSFREYDGKPLQQMAVDLAIANESLLAVFPTGGGKSITFQVPALISGELVKGLTVVISPLQSLMKDQVDNLAVKYSINEAVTINGSLNPIERAEAIKKVENGLASILYISPESLRSKTIERMLLRRNVSRFVIDEAHCLSSWGHDFRVDYLYIAEFIQNLQEKKGNDYRIPVSCFTATAKVQVIEDIVEYFKSNLNIELKVLSASSKRHNLSYEVMHVNDEEVKYVKLRELIKSMDCPTIIYVSRTKVAEKLAYRLQEDRFEASFYHGQMPREERVKSQTSFMKGETKVIVATTAFGMGVDKDNVGLVVHYNISDSIENYVQEAGRAGRNQEIDAKCVVLYSPKDIEDHLALSLRTRISKNEINQIWKAIKTLTSNRKVISNSALEIAREAGWDETGRSLSTRVATAISTLEQSGYIKRGMNNPRVFADSILADSVIEVRDTLESSTLFSEEQVELGVLVMQKLIAEKMRTLASDEVPEMRVDYIADSIGKSREQIIEVISLLREVKVLDNTKDLVASIKRTKKTNTAVKRLDTFVSLEEDLLAYIGYGRKLLNLKEFNEDYDIEQVGASIKDVRTLINYLHNVRVLDVKSAGKNKLNVSFKKEKENYETLVFNRNKVCQFVLDYIYDLSELEDDIHAKVGFSVIELKEAYNKNIDMLSKNATSKDIENALYYLSCNGMISLDGGFMVIYNPWRIEKLDFNPQKQFTNNDYKTLDTFYENKVQQIHVVAEYARKMIDNYEEALEFVDDYFVLEYKDFLKKYFKGDRAKQLKIPISPEKFKLLVEGLNETQTNIFKDNQSDVIVVAAGPGSGKTKLLVHKLASLVMIEKTRHEQLLMLTFSRAAVTEFQERLREMIGSSANYIEIKTFHSFCFDLLGKVGDLDKSKDIIKNATEKIINNQVEKSRITKTALVIDEAQDITEEEFKFLEAIINKNDNIRVIAVGDDDQNIYAFRGSDNRYFRKFNDFENSKKYELLENFRSKKNIVDFSNRFSKKIGDRMKENEMYSNSPTNGVIRVHRYTNGEYVVPFVKNVVDNLSEGSTGVFVRNNAEAFMITGLLQEEGVNAKLIQSMKQVSLFNTFEMRCIFNFVKERTSTGVINDELWKQLKFFTKNQFSLSTKYPLIIEVLKTYQRNNPKTKYFSDFEIFIRESSLDDFVMDTSAKVMVSTIHKTKGRQFDDVYILYDTENEVNNEELRLLYVGITRARNNLTVHTTHDVFDGIKPDNTTFIKDSRQHEDPNCITMICDPGLINLGSIKYTQNVLKELVCGETLYFKDFKCINSEGDPVVSFSSKMSKYLEKYFVKGYTNVECYVNDLIYWFDRKEEKKYLIVLPMLKLYRYNKY